MNKIRCLEEIIRTTYQPNPMNLRLFLPSVRLSVCFLSGIFCFVSLQATVIPVLNTDDDGANSLRAGIVFSQNGDTLDLQGISGSIRLDSVLLISHNLHIQGPGAGLLSLDGQDQSRIFRISELDSLYLDGLSLLQGNSFGDTITPGGGAIFIRGRLRAENCVFRDNFARVGGAIHLTGFGGRETRLWLENCSFFRNEATLPTAALVQGGGAISGDNRQEGVAQVFARNCTFSNNIAGTTGGAIYLISDPNSGGRARMELINCTIAENTAARCGGIDNAESDEARITNCLITANTGNPNHPDLLGAFSSQGNNLVEQNTPIDWRPAPQSSDLIGIDALLGPLANNGSVLLTHSLRCGSPAIDAGNDAVAPLLDLRGESREGLSDIGSHERKLSDLAITNRKDQGLGSLRQAILLACPGDTLRLNGIQGGILLTEELLIEQDLVLEGNAAQAVLLRANGPFRIFEVAANTSLELSWLTLHRGNPELFGGGAILNKGNLKLSYLSIQDNQAESGGAIANYGSEGPASLSLFNCTLSGNKALFLDGGAIDNRPFGFGATVSLSHCTIANNQASNKGGGIYNETGGTIELYNSLISNNQASSGADAFGSFTSLGNNLIQQVGDWTLSGGSNDLSGQDPLLEPLADYGGPTHSQRLQAGSPAINAGNNQGIAPFDQRGFARIFNTTTDIGAYEYDPATALETLFSPNELSLFPNPATRLVQFDLTEMSPASCHVSLLDLQGKEVRTWSFRELSGSFSVEQLPAGVYLVQIQSEHRLWTSKLQVR